MIFLSECLAFDIYIYIYIYIYKYAYMHICHYNATMALLPVSDFQSRVEEDYKSLATSCTWKPKKTLPKYKLMNSIKLSIHFYKLIEVKLIFLIKIYLNRKGFIEIKTSKRHFLVPFYSSSYHFRLWLFFGSISKQTCQVHQLCKNQSYQK